MMHYDLIDKNKAPVILEEFYNPNKTLYGLVKNCYNGISYDSYYDKLYKLSKELEENLLSYFNVNTEDICLD